MLAHHVHVLGSSPLFLPFATFLASTFVKSGVELDGKKERIVSGMTTVVL